jgi:hypothetical protein
MQLGEKPRLTGPERRVHTLKVGRECTQCPLPCQPEKRRGRGNPSTAALMILNGWGRTE